jgi:cyclic nucleotide gated channel, plant
VASDQRFRPSTWPFVNPFRSLLHSGYLLRSFSLSLPFITSRSRNYTNTPKKTPKMLDPSDKLLLHVNRFFVMLCILAVAVDPLVLYLPITDYTSNCIGIDQKLAVASTVVRTIIDLLYLPKIVLKFRTAYSTSTQVGAGELITDPTLVAKRYLKTYFLMDLFSVLPIPQVKIQKSLSLFISGRFFNLTHASSIRSWYHQFLQS